MFFMCYKHVDEVTTLVICCKHHPSKNDKGVLKNTSSILNVIMPYVPVSYQLCFIYWTYANKFS
jgi:hypothetical protein